MDHPHGDNNISDQYPTVEAAVSQEPNNGQMLLKRRALNDMAQWERRDNMQTKKARNWSHDAGEGQQRNPNEVTSGVTARDTEGAQEKEKLQEESVPATNVQANNRVNISLGHSDLCVEGGGFGPEATWPNSCCCY